MKTRYFVSQVFSLNVIYFKKKKIPNSSNNRFHVSSKLQFCSSAGSVCTSGSNAGEPAVPAAGAVCARGLAGCSRGCTFLGWGLLWEDAVPPTGEEQESCPSAQPQRAPLLKFPSVK